MTLYLVHKHLNGEPVGIWDDRGNSFYQVNDNHEEALGRATVKAKGVTLPWSQFVDRMSGTMNMREAWGQIDTPLDLGMALAQVRADYQARQSAKVAVDH